MAILKPSPGSPSTFSGGTVTPLKCSSRRSLPRRPIVSKRLPTSKPSMPFSTMKAVWRRSPSCSVAAKVTNTEPLSPLPM